MSEMRFDSGEPGVADLISGIDCVEVFCASTFLSTGIVGEALNVACFSRREVICPAERGAERAIQQEIVAKIAMHFDKIFMDNNPSKKEQVGQGWVTVKVHLVKIVGCLDCVTVTVPKATS